MTTIADLAAEARAFLDATCVPRDETSAAFVWAEGSDRVNLLEEVDPAESSAQLVVAKRSFSWTEYVFSTPGARIGGGTEEIVRNTVAERVLGLPKGPKV